MHFSHPFAMPQTKKFQTFFLCFLYFPTLIMGYLSNNSLTEVVYLIFKIALEIKINQWMTSFSKSLFILGINNVKRTLVASQQ